MLGTKDRQESEQALMQPAVGRWIKQQHRRQGQIGIPGIADSVAVVCCAAVLWWIVPKALLPKGKGRDVYPRVQVNGRAVCAVPALCASVFRKGRRAGRRRPEGSPPGYRS